MQDERESAQNVNDLGNSLEPANDFQESINSSEKQPKDKRPFRNKKVLILSLSLVLLAIGSAAGFFLLKNDKKQSDKNTPTGSMQFTGTGIGGEKLPFIDNTSFADKFLPSFADIRGYLEHNGEHWYAAFGTVIITKDNEYRIISARDQESVTSFTGLAEYGGDVWISGQGGVLKQGSGDSLKSYLGGESNTQFYVDKFDNKLYVMTFNDFFVYNENNDSFSSMGVTSVEGQNMKVGFSNDYIVVARQGQESTQAPVRLYNKSTKQWKDSEKLNLVDDGISGLVEVDDTFIIFGRSRGYTSCEQASKLPATVVYQFIDNKFEERKELTELFKNNEATISGLSLTTLEGGASCNGDGSDAFNVDLVLRNGIIVAENKREAKPDYWGMYTYADKREQLETELGFSPSIRLLRSSNGQVASNWEAQDLDLVSIHYTADSMQSAFSKDENQLSLYPTFIECGGESYMLSTTGKTIDFGNPYLEAIYKKLKDGSYKKVYETTNKPLYESVDPELALANLEGVCVDGKIVILGNSDLAVFSPSNNKLQKQSLGGHTYMRQSLISAKRDGFYYIDIDSKKLVSIKNSVKTKKEVSIGKSLKGTMEDFNTILISYNGESAVLSSNGQKTGEDNVILTVSTRDGSATKVTKIDNKGVWDGVGLNEDSFIVQYTTGETQIIDKKTHSTTTISKAKSVDSSNDPPFAINIDLNSDFVISDGYLWFSASNWGIVGYKIP